jgi:6-phosphogluconolactonase
VQELSGTVTAFDYNGGKLTEKSAVSLLPSDYRGNPTSADIHVSPDGRFLYASNRHPSNTIAIFKIDAGDGNLQLIGHQPSGGKAPRNFNFDPSENFLLIANQDTDNIVVLRVNRKTGMLSPTGQEIKVPKPVCIKWAR